MRNKNFLEESEGSSGTASVLRLVENYFYSGRTIYADSTFASVRTALKCSEKGLHFMGLVKTAHKKYPMKYFKGLNNLTRGSSIHLVTENSFPKLIATAWSDKKLKTLISTCGTSGAAISHKRKRYIAEPDGSVKIINKYTPIDLITSEYFHFCHKIDVHNHRRQGIVALERTLKTHSWSLRLISTILGIILVDAYMMFKQEQSSVEISSSLTDTTKGDEDESSFRDFTHEVCKLLLTNTLGNSRFLPRNLYPHVEDLTPPNSHSNIQNVGCQLHPLSTNLSLQRKRERNGRKKSNSIQLRCSICKNHASFYCSNCSTVEKIITICGPLSKSYPSCLNKHLAGYVA
jgi:hypothetical protein